jgi:hypothetical protein
MKPENTLWLAEFMEQMESKLAPAEQEFADALLGIVRKYGKLADRDANGIWVGYESAKENENKEIGVKCSNCYFYESEKVCSIIVQEIEPEGLCRLAAIPPGLVKMGPDDDMDSED